MPLRMSTLFLRTLREDPADAEVPSHRLLPYWLGANNLVRTVVKRGHIVLERDPD